MSPFDDDPSSWSDDPVLRALTGAGSAEELSGEAEALAAFRAHASRRSGRRFAGRLGVAGTAMAAAVVLSGSAAAAYTGSLPRPVQSAAHSVFQIAGVPAAPASSSVSGGGHPARIVVPSSPSASPTAPVVAPLPVDAPTPTPSKSARVRKTPATKPSTPPASPSASPSPTPRSSGTPTPSPTPTTPTATPTPTPVVAGSITIVLSESLVQTGDTVTISGQVDAADGSALVGQTVWLLERVPGVAGVAQVATATSDDNGSVTFTSPTITRSARFSLVTEHDINSAAVSVIVVPTVQASIAPQDDTDWITVTSQGTEEGDVVSVDQRVGSDWQLVASSQLDADGGASFGVPIPVDGPVHYRVVVARTPAHAAAVTPVTATPPA